MFITIEGGDGVGKSTLAKKLAQDLAMRRKPVVLTHEPGSTTVGAAIRDIIMYNQLDPETEILLFAADRARHVKEIIEPALRNGAIVICDRYHLSTAAYQVHGRGLSRAEWGGILNISKSKIPSLKPDFIFLLDGKGFNSKQADRIGLEDKDFHRRVRKGFLKEINPWVKLGKACVLDVDEMSEDEVFCEGLFILDSIVVD